MNSRASLPLSISISWRVQAILVVLLGLAFAVRVHDLERKSLWSDEGLTLRRAEQPLSLVIENVNLIPVDPDYQDGADAGTVIRSPDLHPPLYFLLMHFWTQVAGTSEFALRFPSVVAGTLIVPLIFTLGSSLFTRETAMWAALLAALSPYLLWYAQEARMYTWLVALGITSIYTFLPLVEEKPHFAEYVAYFAATLALLYTHYAGFLLLAFETVVYSAYRLRKHRLEALLVLAVLGLGILPLLPFVRSLLRMQPFSFTFRSLPTIVKEGLGSFSLGPTPEAVQPWWRLLPFLILCGTGSLMLDVSRRRRAWVFVLGCLAVPTAAQYAFSFLQPTYMNPRHMMVVVPAWELLMAQGLATLRRRFTPSWALLLGLVLFLRGSVAHEILTSHRYWKDDIRGAAQFIEERARPGDAIVLHQPVIRLTFDYYYDGECPEIAIPRYGNNGDVEQARTTFAEWSQRYDRIWFMYGPPPTYFPSDALRDWAERNLFKVQQREFEAWWTYVGVAAYDQSAPIVQALPAGVTPVDEPWAGLKLVGFEAEDTPAGENGWLHLYWRAQEEAPQEPPDLKIQLRDQAGTIWRERTTEMLPFYPPAAWPSDGIVRVDYRVPLPEEMPPTNYSVVAAPLGLGDLRPVGNMKVSRPGSQTPSRRSVARFGQSVELVEAELKSGKFRTGYPIIGSLTWRADGTPRADYQLGVRLVDPRGRERAANEMPLSAAGFPTSDWLAGDRVAGKLVLPLPGDLPGGTYRVQICVTDTLTGQVLPLRRWYGSREWLSLGTVQVEAWPLVTELPRNVDYRMDSAEIAGVIGLRGYDLATEDDTLKITLYWQAEEPVTNNYHVFVHLGDPHAPPLAQASGLPVDWTRPTKGWREGEVIVDEHTVPLTDVAPGQYSLVVGLYDPETGQRPLTAVDGHEVQGGYISLQDVVVE